MVRPLHRRIAWLLPAVAVTFGLSAPPLGAASRATDAQFNAAGVTLSWSVATPTRRVDPGSTVVARLQAGSRKAVFFRVVRLSKSGRVMYVLKAHRLTRGRVSVKLSKKAGRRYAATVRIGKLRARTVLKTGFAPIVLEAPAPAPAPPPQTPHAEDGLQPPTPDAVATTPTPTTPVATTPEPTCDLLTELKDLRPPTATLRIATTPARAGERRTFEVENTSPRCVYGGPGYYWARWFRGRWMSIANLPALPLGGDVTGLPPGKRAAGEVSVPTNAAPGHYRVTVLWFAATALTAEIDVVR